MLVLQSEKYYSGELAKPTNKFRVNMLWMQPISVAVHQDNLKVVGATSCS